MVVASTKQYVYLAVSLLLSCDALYNVLRSNFTFIHLITLFFSQSFKQGKDAVSVSLLNPLVREDHLVLYLLPSTIAVA